MTVLIKIKISSKCVYYLRRKKMLIVSIFGLEFKSQLSSFFYFTIISSVGGNK